MADIYAKPIYKEPEVDEPFWLGPPDTSPNIFDEFLPFPSHPSVFPSDLTGILQSQPTPWTQVVGIEPRPLKPSEFGADGSHTISGWINDLVGFGAEAFQQAGGPFAHAGDAIGNIEDFAAARAEYNAAQDAASRANAAAAAAAARAQELERREQQRLFDKQELEQALRDIEMGYAPNLKYYDEKVAAEQGKQRKDTGIYTGLMSGLPTIYKNVGMYTDRHLQQAQKAMMLQDSKARGQIDQSFASAQGRVRAMVLSLSKGSPDMADTLGQGLDEITAFIDRGMAQDQAGWDAVLVASNQLAEASANAALTSGVGQLWRDREQAITTYQNTIDGMMLERRRLVGEMEAALQKTREWAELQAQQQEAAWALQDSFSQGGGYGGGPGSAGMPGFEFGDLTPTSAAEMGQHALAIYLEEHGFDPLLADDFAIALANAATVDMDFGTWLSRLSPEQQAVFADQEAVFWFGAQTYRHAAEEWSAGYADKPSSAYWVYTHAYNEAVAGGADEGEARWWAQTAVDQYVERPHPGTYQSPASPDKPPPISYPQGLGEVFLPPASTQKKG